MKRNELVQRLIKEGFSEKTLVNFSDKQLFQLSKRVLGEAVMKQVKVLSMTNPKDAEEVNSLVNDPNKVNAQVKQGHVQVTKESKKLSKDQSDKMDTDKDGDIDFKDLKNLRNKKKKVDVKKEKPSTNKKEVKEWVSELVNEKYHNFTKKGEIMELIQSKMTNTTSHGPNVKKGHNGIPEFMSYDAIKKSEMKEGDTKTKPKVKPTTTPTKPKKDNPYRPKPGKETNPKALTTNEDEVKTKPKVSPKPTTKPKKDSPYRPKPGKETNPKALNEKKK